MRAAEPVDACELPAAGALRIDGDRLVFPLRGYGLRSFRVRP
jgi:hypothetical protein